jgi:CubicO group peptidase (beta-lactamase class C family)
MIATLLLATALTAGTKSKIDQIFAAYDKADSPGCAVAIVQDGAVAYERGYGMADLEHDVKITPSTNFDIASTSKEFTGAIIMQLAAEGKLGFDDDIRKYVPEIPDYGTKITISQLLHHTSGLRDYTDLLGFFGYNSEDWTGEREALMLLSRQKKLNFAPDTEYSYSNTGFFLLTVIAKRAAGKPFRDLVRERIYTPLGMTGSDVRDDHTRIQKNRAVAYSPHGDGWAIDMSDWEQVGDGGVNTSADDMAKWMTGGARFIESLKTFEKLESGESPVYGAGLVFAKRAGRPMYFHNGAWAGYRSALFILPDDHIGTAVLCNAGNSNPANLSFQILDTILGRVPSVSNEPIPPHADGVYLHRASGTTFTFPGPPLVPLGNGRFSAGKSGLTVIEFKDNAIDVTENEAVKRHHVLMPPPKPLSDQFNGRYQSAEISADWTAFTRNGKLFLSGDRLGEVELTPLYENGFSLFGYVIEFNPDGFTLSNRGIWRFPFVKVK